MKKLILSILLVHLLTAGSIAQVGISIDNSLPDASAMLDVKSTTRGVLVPRMTEAERNSISNPAKGLLIFYLDNNQYYSNSGTSSVPNWVMVSSQWSNVGQNIYFNSGNVAIGSTQSPVLKLQVTGRIGADYGSITQPSIAFGNGSENTGLASPVYNTLSFITAGSEKGRLNSDGELMLGTMTGNSAVLIDLTSTSRGFLPPRLTSSQMNAIVSPPAGLMIFNTTLSTMCWFNGTNWEAGTNRDHQSCGSVTYGGKTYNSVVIGMQCWMTENLDIGTMITGTQDQTNNSVVEKYCYANSADNCAVYGGLYQWGEMVQYLNGTSNTSNWNPVPSTSVQGICPAGWHLPTDAEFTAMREYLGGATAAGGHLKEEGTDHWLAPNTGATNDTYFTALPGGVRENSGSFFSINSMAGFRSATEASATGAGFWWIFYMYANISHNSNDLKTGGISVRCLKN